MCHCGHGRALTGGPTWDRAVILSAPGDLATGSSRMSPPETVLNRRQHLRLVSGTSCLLPGVVHSLRLVHPLASVSDPWKGRPRGSVRLARAFTVTAGQSALSPPNPASFTACTYSWDGSPSPPAHHSPSFQSLLLWELNLWGCQTRFSLWIRVACV